MFDIMKKINHEFGTTIDFFVLYCFDILINLIKILHLLLKIENYKVIEFNKLKKNL